MRIAVQGIGVTGGFGCGVDEFTQALLSGESRRGEITVPTASGPVELSAFRADTFRLEEFVPKRTLRRIDHYSRLGLLGAYLALADAEMLDADKSRMGVIVASGYGATATTFAFLDSIINDGDTCASPTHFANSVHNSAAANISILLGATGPSLTISQFHLSVPSALLTAQQWLAEGRVDHVLFGAIDELSDLIGYAWYRQRGSAKHSTMAPLQTGEESAVPGEGAAFFLLSRLEEDSCGYCAIEEITSGRSQGNAPLLPAAGLLILGADGRRELGSRYAELATQARIACYTPLYGSMPAGPAFDLAAASLIIKKGTVFATPGSAGCDIPATVSRGGEQLGTAHVSCLTLADDDGFGLVKMGRI